MGLNPLRFAAYADAVDTPNVVVDGSPNEATTLVVSHWPGMSTPADCDADASAQMVFRYLERGADLHGDATVVTNNHFDQDGLAGITAMVDPELGLRHRARLEGLATAGDFGVAVDRGSARLSMAVAALADPARSPLTLPRDHDERCAVLYEAALGLLPSWLEDPERCRDLWAEEDAELDAAEAVLAAGELRIDEHPDLDLAVVTLPATVRSSGHRFCGRAFDGIHPMALHSATNRSTVLVIDPLDGRHHLTCRYEGWVQFRSRPIRPRVDLRPLAEQLIASEPREALWTATAPSDLTPELHTVEVCAASSIEPPALVARVSRYLADAPPAWDPYATS